MSHLDAASSFLMCFICAIRLLFSVVEVACQLNEGDVTDCSRESYLRLLVLMGLLLFSVFSVGWQYKKKIVIKEKCELV